jgi:hypothetical protein
LFLAGKGMIGGQRFYVSDAFAAIGVVAGLVVVDHGAIGIGDQQGAA